MFIVEVATVVVPVAVAVAVVVVVVVVVLVVVVVVGSFALSSTMPANATLAITTDETEACVVATCVVVFCFNRCHARQTSRDCAA